MLIKFLPPAGRENVVLGGRKVPAGGIELDDEKEAKLVAQLRREGAFIEVKKSKPAPKKDGDQ